MNIITKVKPILPYSAIIAAGSLFGGFVGFTFNGTWAWFRLGLWLGLLGVVPVVVTVGSILHLCRKSLFPNLTSIRYFAIVGFTAGALTHVLFIVVNRANRFEDILSLGFWQASFPAVGMAYILVTSTVGALSGAIGGAFSR